MSGERGPGWGATGEVGSSVHGQWEAETLTLTRQEAWLFVWTWGGWVS